MARGDPKHWDDGSGGGGNPRRQPDDGRGRRAGGPTAIPLSGWRDILLRAWREAGTDNVGLIAAGVAFYSFLALVPMLGAFILTYGLVADPATVLGHVQSIARVLPSDAAKLIGDQLLSLTQQSAGKTGLGLLASLALSIYGAMRGAGAIVIALNIAYDEEERRGFIKLYLLSLAITLGALVVAVLGMLAVGALAALEALIPQASTTVLNALRALFLAAAGLGAVLLLAALYRYGPDRDEPKWRWLTPGALLATLGWVAMTLGFGLYTANFANYNATYGALGAIVVLLVWLYLSAYIVIFGAELNAEMEHQTARDTTKGPELPMGARDAYVADTVGEVPAGIGKKRGLKPPRPPEAQAEH
jgi:membrane protein